MKKFFLLLLIAGSITLEGRSDPFFLQSRDQLIIIVDNRILAKVNGKAISVVDVQKKMDFLFYRQFPQYSSNVQAKLQFYLVNWKSVLKELVDKELILADAIEGKIEVSSGDIRQEMEQLFGPNILSNLEKANLSFSEAWDIVKDDLTLRRMLFFRVNSKALKAVTPKEIRTAFDEWVKTHPKEELWTWKTLTIRGEDPEENGKMAKWAHDELSSKRADFDSIGALLKSLQQDGSRAQFALSDTFSQKTKEIAPAFLEVLGSMEPSSYSSPIAQKSKMNDALVWRIFYLMKKEESGGNLMFSEMEAKLKDQLTEKAMDKESSRYLAKLYKHFDVHQSRLAEMVPQDFQPFRLL